MHSSVSVVFFSTTTNAQWVFCEYEGIYYRYIPTRFSALSHRTKMNGPMSNIMCSTIKNYLDVSMNSKSLYFLMHIIYIYIYIYIYILVNQHGASCTCKEE